MQFLHSLVSGLMDTLHSMSLELKFFVYSGLSDFQCNKVLHYLFKLPCSYHDAACTLELQCLISLVLGLLPTFRWELGTGAPFSLRLAGSCGRDA